MEENPFPILQFTDERQAIIEPAGHIQPLEGMPRHGVVTFFQDVGLLDQLTIERGRAPDPCELQSVGNVLVYHAGQITDAGSSP